DLRRHRRRWGATPRTDRRRGGGARVVRHARRLRPGCRQLAGARVSGRERRAGRRGTGRLRGLPPRPADRPVGAPRADRSRAARAGRVNEAQLGAALRSAGAVVVNEPQLVAALRSAGCVFAEDEARILVAEATSPAELMAWTARGSAGGRLAQIRTWGCV